MESVDDKDAQISALQNEVQQLQEAKQLLEKEFGEGRAKLKQLYLQKEEEVRALTVELEEANSRVVIAECTADNRVETEQRKCREEMATLEQLYREEAEAGAAEARERQQQLARENRRLETDKRKILQLYHQLQEELEQQRAATPPPSGTGAGLLSPGLLSGITKSIIAKHVPALNASLTGSASATPTSPPPISTTTTSGSDATTADPSAAPPSGGETNAAFSDGASDSEGRVMEDLLGAAEGDAEGGDRSSLLEEVLLPLSRGEGGEQRVGAQEASLSDLELYSGLLRAQKQALTEQLAAATAHNATCRRTEALLRAHARRANDHLLRSERRFLQLTGQLQHLLAPDQLHQLLEDVNKEVPKSSPPADPQQEARGASPKGRRTPDEDEENVYEEVVLPEKVSGATAEGVPSLQVKEDDSEEASLADGGQVVSASEWSAMQLQLQRLSARISSSCTSCATLQSKVSEQQAQLQEAEQQKQVLQKAVERQTAELEREEEYRNNMNEQWLLQVEQFQLKEAQWGVQLQEATRLHDAMLTRWKCVMAELKTQLASLTGDRENNERHINRVQRENERLAGRHLKKARALQEELIDLPHGVEELQLLLLRLKEEVITATVAREEAEEALSSTRALMEAQQHEERQQARALQEGLQQDNRSLREAVGRLQASLGPQPPTEEQQQQKALELHTLKEQLNDMLLAKRALEGEVGEQKGRVASLQHDLELSEQTQRDFVRLSQDLQVQLEKIRQSDSEVRWQHEDDVDECNGCKKSFSAVRRKHHCRHCGRVFCVDCVSKTVTAGRASRQCRVCHVCHTLLVKTATPYFSEALRQQ